MSAHEHDEALERALRLVAPPAARPEFKSELRGRFLAADGVPESAPIASIDAARDSGRGTATGSARDDAGSAGRDTVRRRFPLVPLFVLAAAAAVVALFFSVGESVQPWRVIDARGSGMVVVDGIEIDPDDAARFERALASARSIDTRLRELRMVRGSEVVLDLGPGTRLAQIRFPAAGPYSLFTDAGSLRVATGDAFGGKKLRVQTRDLDLDVVGTVFAVDVEAEGSCVCCLEGSVAVQPKAEAAAKPVEPGRMCFASSDRTHAVVWGASMPAHSAPLETLRAALAACFARAKQ